MTGKICRVNECGKPVRSIGLCNAHYFRLRKTGSVGGKPTCTPLQWLRDVAASAPTDCAIWPFAVDPKSGYGLIVFNGKTRTAHRVSLILRSGIDPADKEAAHGPCHNRRCCNPLHLSWKTVTENHGDKPRDGTDNRGRKHYQAKLTEGQVKAIRADRRQHKEIAADYGVSRSNVSNIKAGNHWKWLQ